MTLAKSVTKTAPSKSQVSAALPAGILRAIKTAGGKGALADRMDTSVKTLDRALIGETLPEPHTMLSATLVDVTACDEVFALYGFRAAPLHAAAANDMQLAGELSGAVTEFLIRLADGKRCHIDTGVIAELFRHLIPQMQSIVDENDAQKAVRA